MAKPQYADRAWRWARRNTLHRDHHRCQINGPGCTTTATQVDHIIPLALGGPRLDPTNLRAACAHCNASRTANINRTPTPLTW